MKSRKLISAMTLTDGTIVETAAFPSFQEIKVIKDDHTTNYTLTNDAANQLRQQLIAGIKGN